jgi:hypothetical protein
LNGLEANPFTHAGKQSIKLLGIKALGQVADVQTNAHGKEGRREEGKRVLALRADTTRWESARRFLPC